MARTSQRAARRCLSTILSTALLAMGMLRPAAFGAATNSLAPAAEPQTAPAPASKNLLGTVTSATADSLTIKLESGGQATIAITPDTRLLRTAPGEKTLKGAATIQLTDLTTGDRVLVLRVTPGADATHYSAAAVVAMKQADIAQVHASQSEDWQRRGVGGIVKSVQAAAPAASPTAAAAASAPGATILVASQANRVLTIHVTQATILRRYAPDSVSFADAQPANLSDVQPGDQLRARGEHSADGSEITAAEIVSGSFRNVAGTIASIDPAQQTVTVTDLATKKPVLLRVTAETQMRKLPPEMAQRLAAREARSENAVNGGAAQPGTGRPAQPGGRPGSESAAGAGASGGSGSPRPRGDAASMLQHAPVITLADLKKGDAIMVVTSRADSATTATRAITLIAGVEALLEGSSRGASDTLFNASWNLGGGGGAEAQ